MQENIRWCLEQRWTRTKPQSKFSIGPGLRQNPLIISLNKITYQLLGCFSCLSCVTFAKTFSFFAFYCSLFLSPLLCFVFSFSFLSLFFFTRALFRRSLFSISSNSSSLSFLLFSIYFFTFPVLLFSLFSSFWHCFGSNPVHL
jgi:hypothetical protein